MARPFAAVAVVVPCKAALPAARAAVTTVLLSELIRFPNASSIRIIEELEKLVPAVAEIGGCVWIVSLAAGAALTVKVLLTALVRPVALAVSCLLPAVSISRVLKDARPFPAAKPMSAVVAPCNDPPPLLRLKVRVRLAGKPFVELFPKLSRLLTTGCVAKVAPAMAPEGCVAKANTFAAAGLTAIIAEVVLERLPLVN